MISSAELIYNLIYNPFETKLLKYGNNIGAETMNGLMYQGIKFFEIWIDELVSLEEKYIYNLPREELTM